MGCINNIYGAFCDHCMEILQWKISPFVLQSSGFGMTYLSNLHNTVQVWLEHERTWTGWNEVAKPWRCKCYLCHLNMAEKNVIVMALIINIHA